MKVQSTALLNALEERRRTTSPRLVSIAHSRSISRDALVIDGPFAESKEICSHVAILARRRRETTSGA